MYGFALTAYGIGGALGALAVSSGRLPRRYLTVMMLMWGLGSLPLVLVGATWSFPVMATALFVIGVTDGAGMVIWGRCCSAGSRPRCWAGCRAWTSSCRWH